MWHPESKSRYDLSGIQELIKNISDEELDELAKLDFHGRQIKNVLRTAQLLAQEENASTSDEDMKTIPDLRFF